MSETTVTYEIKPGDLVESFRMLTAPSSQTDSLAQFKREYSAIGQADQLRRLMLQPTTITVEGPDDFSSWAHQAISTLGGIGLGFYLEHHVGRIRAGTADGAPRIGGLPAAGWTNRPRSATDRGIINVLWQENFWLGFPEFAATVAHEAAHLAANRRDPRKFLDENGPEAVEQLVLWALIGLGYE